MNSTHAMDLAPQWPSLQREELDDYLRWCGANELLAALELDGLMELPEAPVV